MKRNPIKKIVAPNAFSLSSAFVLLALLFVSYYTQHRVEPAVTHTLFVFDSLQAFWDSYPFVSFLISLLLVALIAFLLFKSNEMFAFIRVRTMLPSLLFIFFLLISNYKIEHCSGLFACLYLLLFSWIFLSAYQEKEPTKPVFNAFFFLSVGSLYSFDLMLLVPACWLSLFILRIENIRVWLASLIGIAVPYILCIAVLHFTTHNEANFLMAIKQKFLFTPLFDNLFTFRIYFELYLLVMFILTFVHFLLTINADKIRARRMMFFFFLMTFTLFVIMTLKTDSFVDLYPLLALMLSIVLGHLFSLVNSRFSLTFFLLMVTSGIVFHFFSV